MKIKKIREMMIEAIVCSFVGVNLNNLGMLIYKLTFPNKSIDNYYENLFFTFILLFIFLILKSFSKQKY